MTFHSLSFLMAAMIFVFAQTPMDIATKAADVSSKQTDRWHEDALLVIFFITLGALTRWGMRQLDNRDKRIENQALEIAAIRKEFADFAVGQAKEMAVVITRNSQVIDANTKMSESKMAILDRIEQQSRIQLHYPAPGAPPPTS